MTDYLGIDKVYVGQGVSEARSMLLRPENGVDNSDLDGMRFELRTGGDVFAFEGFAPAEIAAAWNRLTTPDAKRLIASVKSYTLNEDDGDPLNDVRGTGVEFTSRVKGEDFDLSLVWTDAPPPGSQPRNTVQRITFAGNPTGGVFRVTCLDELTANITFVGGAAQVATLQAALIALPSLNAGDVTVAHNAGLSTSGKHVYDVTFLGRLAQMNVPVMQADGSGLLGGDIDFTIVERQKGTLGLEEIRRVEIIAPPGAVGGGTLELRIGRPDGDRAVIPVPGIQWNSTAAQAQTVIANIVGPDRVVCSGGPFPATPLDFRFTGDWGPEAMARNFITDFNRISFDVVNKLAPAAGGLDYSVTTVQTALDAGSCVNRWRWTLSPGVGTLGLPTQAAKAEHYAALRVKLASEPQDRIIKCAWPGLHAMRLQEAINEDFGREVVRVVRANHRQLLATGRVTATNPGTWYGGDAPPPPPPAAVPRIPVMTEGGPNTGEAYAINVTNPQHWWAFDNADSTSVGTDTPQHSYSVGYVFPAAQRITDVALTLWRGEGPAEIPASLRVFWELRAGVDRDHLGFVSSGSTLIDAPPATGVTRVNVAAALPQAVTAKVWEVRLYAQPLAAGVWPMVYVDLGRMQLLEVPVADVPTGNQLHVSGWYNEDTFEFQFLNELNTPGTVESFEVLWLDKAAADDDDWQAQESANGLVGYGPDMRLTKMLATGYGADDATYDGPPILDTKRSIADYDRQEERDTVSTLFDASDVGPTLYVSRMAFIDEPNGARNECHWTYRLLGRYSGASGTSQAGGFIDYRHAPFSEPALDQMLRFVWRRVSDGSQTAPVGGEAIATSRPFRIGATADEITWVLEGLIRHQSAEDAEAVTGGFVEGDRFGEWFPGRGNLDAYGTLWDTWNYDNVAGSGGDQRLTVRMLNAAARLPWHELGYRLDLEWVAGTGTPTAPTGSGETVTVTNLPVIEGWLSNVARPNRRNHRVRLTLLQEPPSKLLLGVGGEFVEIDTNDPADVIAYKLNELSTLGHWLDIDPTRLIAPNPQRAPRAASEPIPEAWRNAATVFGATFRYRSYASAPGNLERGRIEVEWTGYGRQSLAGPNIEIRRALDPLNVFVRVTRPQAMSGPLAEIQAMQLLAGGVDPQAPGSNIAAFMGNLRGTAVLAYGLSGNTTTAVFDPRAGDASSPNSFYQALTTLMAGRPEQDRFATLQGTTHNALADVVTFMVGTQSYDVDDVSTIANRLDIPLVRVQSHTFNNSSIEITRSSIGGDGTATGLGLYESQAGSSRNHWDEPLNWLPVGVPGSDDTAILDDCSAQILYGLKQWDACRVRRFGTPAVFELAAERRVFRNGQRVWLEAAVADAPTGLVSGYYYIIGTEDGLFSLAIEVNGAKGPVVTVPDRGSGEWLPIGVRNLTLKVYARWPGKVLGLSNYTKDGTLEVRPKYLALGSCNAEIGIGGVGQGPTRFQIDTGSSLPSNVVVLKTAGVTGAVPGVVCLFDHALSTCEVKEGSLAIAPYADQRSKLKSLRIDLSGRVLAGYVTLHDRMQAPQGTFTVTRLDYASTDVRLEVGG